MDYIRITDDNIEKEHICCAMSGKQGVIKKEWLKQRFKEGLVFCRSTERGKCFIHLLLDIFVIHFVMSIMIYQFRNY